MSNKESSGQGFTPRGRDALNQLAAHARVGASTAVINETLYGVDSGEILAVAQVSGGFIRKTSQRRAPTGD